MEISTWLCQYVRVLSTCLTNSRPVPSRERLIATTTMSAIVMVRFRRSPIQISERTNCERMLADPLVVLGVGNRSVCLAVHPPRLVSDNLAVFELDDPLTHRVDDGRVVSRHHDGRPGPVDPVEHLHDADRGGR